MRLYAESSAVLAWLLGEAGGEEILDRARRPFPGEPIRTLDALHLASALTTRAAIPELAVLSLDGSIRRTSFDLGFDVLPAPKT